MSSCVNCGGPLTSPQHFCPRCGSDPRAVPAHQSPSSAAATFSPSAGRPAGAERDNRHEPLSDDLPTCPLPRITAAPQARGRLTGSGRAGIAACYVLIVGLVLFGLAVAAAPENRPNTVAAPAPTEADRNSGGDGVVEPQLSCSAPPIMRVLDVDVTSGGGMRVSLVVTTPCSIDQLLDGSAVTVELVADGGFEIVTGYFDFSASPLLIPANGSSTAQLVYPAGTYIATDYRNLVVRCDAATSVATGLDGSTNVTVALSQAGTGRVADPDEAARAALERQIRLDASDVATLVTNWVPQISSKRVGLVVDGNEFDYSDILQDHMTLRAEYPQARLLYSGDWSSYRGDDFYVTVIAQPYDAGEEALSWCRGANRDADHCFATLLSRTAAPEDAVVFQE